jgi:hypothetical protein
LLYLVLSTKTHSLPVLTEGCYHLCSMPWPDVSSSNVSFILLLAGHSVLLNCYIRGLSKKYPTLGREKKVLYLGGYNT